MAEVGAQKLYEKVSKRPFLQQLLALLKKENRALVQLDQDTKKSQKGTRATSQDV